MSSYQKIHVLFLLMWGSWPGKRDLIYVDRLKFSIALVQNSLNKLPYKLSTQR